MDHQFFLAAVVVLSGELMSYPGANFNSGGINA